MLTGRIKNAGPTGTRGLPAHFAKQKKSIEVLLKANNTYGQNVNTMWIYIYLSLPGNG